MGLDCIEITGSYQTNACHLALDHLGKDSVINNDSVDQYKAELRCLFDQVVSVFLKEVGCRGIARPVPVELGDRGSVDLFKLFWVVRGRGGYDGVSKNGLWSFVAEELGLDLGLSASVKLICYKYLNELPKWFRENCTDRRLGNGNFNDELEGNLQFLSPELEKKLGGLLFDEVGKKGVDNGVLKLKCDKKNEKFVDKCRVNEDGGKCPNDYGKKVHDDDDRICDSDRDDCVVLDPVSANKKDESHKRKREHLLEMLKWVSQIAKNPDHPSFGNIPEPYKWKEYHGSKELWVRAIRARDTLLRRNLANADESALQKKLKMHPSMYEDNTNNTHQPMERLRCSERIPTLVKSRLCSCCHSCSDSLCKLLTSQKMEAGNCQKEQRQSNADLQDTKMRDDNTPFEADSIEKHVSVGPLFQADVPEWTGVVSESDSKWLGTKIWPLECKKHDSQTYTYPIARGRPKSCECQLPGSVECVRFHIAEERMRLKLELGLVFYRWRFDCMGEEVSLQWTDEEEKRFKDLMRSNLLARNQSLWALQQFPKKTRENLVSYYFNVFLVRQRGYQNRVTPKDIDSDDDESEFGSFGSGFGHEAVKVSGCEFLTCSENKQCTDFE